MANLAWLVNVIAPIVTSPAGMFTQASYHPFQLMATTSQPVALDTITDSGTHAHRDRAGDRWPYRVADLGLFQVLDVAATRDPQRGRLTISVVNRDPHQAIETRVRLHDAKAVGVMTVHEVTGDSPDAVNTFARPGAVSARNSKREVEGEHVDITFAPHSFTLLEVPLA
jgi:alpha-N-arabinofuranosidase